MAEYVGITLRTYQSRKETEFRGGEAVKIQFLEAAFELANRTLGGSDSARDWLTRPVWGLGGVAPVKHMDSLKGYEDVCNLLLRFEHGVYT